jgi:hypothetical protein
MSNILRQRCLGKNAHWSLHPFPFPALGILSTISKSSLVGPSSRFPILGSVRSDPRSCKCRCDLHVPLQATEKGGGNLDLLSPMGHLQLHKCCDTATIKSSVLDSPQQTSLSHYFCVPTLGTLEWHETGNPPPSNAVGCVLGDDILRSLRVVRRKLCIVPQDIAGTTDSQ